MNTPHSAKPMPSEALAPGNCIDAEHPAVRAFAEAHAGDVPAPRARAVAL